jgi:ABC-2 family transporter protein
MIRLTWRQFRTQAGVAVGLLIVVAILFAVTGPHLSHIYNVYERAQAICASSGNCPQVSFKISKTDGLLELIGTALVAIPGLIGAFWGAPLIARELENGTQRLAWTQSISRTRWITVKLAVVGGASIVATALLSLMVTWWSRPIDRSNMNQFGSGLFGERNVVPLGYAAFGFALGVAAGLLIRRTVPAMAATLGVFLGVRLAFTYLVRPHLLAPVHRSSPLDPNSTGFGSTNGGAATLFPGTPNLPNAWIYSTRIVDSHGHGLTSQIVDSACPSLTQSIRGPLAAPNVTVRVPAPVGVQTGLQTCVTKLSGTYHQVVTYQPANRYWTLQCYETAIFVAAALLLAGLIFSRIRRRPS